MAIQFFSSYKSRLLQAALGILLGGLISPLAFATELPTGVLNYVRQKDPKVQVRFDGLVLFSNGQSYVPVIPQDPAGSSDPQQVIATMPDNAAYPDLIQFDNNFFLMRMVQTASGRITFPKLAEYPIQLKEGLLPQDLVLPKNLYIPVELKVILGALPYNPTYTPPEKPVTQASLAKTLKNAHTDSGHHPMSRLTYVFDLVDQRILAVDPINGHKQGSVQLDCVPSTLKLSPDGKLLFVPCLTSNELVVVDTGSNLVKTRIPVGQRPDTVLYLSKTDQIIISNRHSSFLSVVDANSLTSGQSIALPGNGGAMAMVPETLEGPLRLVVADAFSDKVYLVNMERGVVEKTYKALPEIAAIQAFAGPQGRLDIWLVSRTENQAVLLEGSRGEILHQIKVGRKPVDMAAYEDKLLIVSAGANQVDVVDRQKATLLEPIVLDADSFPAGLVVVPSEKRAYVTLAAAKGLGILNLNALQLDSVMPVDFRANLIAMSQDKVERIPAPHTPAPKEEAAPTRTVVYPVPMDVPLSQKEEKNAQKLELEPQENKISQDEPAKQPLPAAAPAPVSPVATSPSASGNKEEPKRKGFWRRESKPASADSRKNNTAQGNGQPQAESKQSDEQAPTGLLSPLSPHNLTPQTMPTGPSNKFGFKLTGRNQKPKTEKQEPVSPSVLPTPPSVWERLNRNAQPAAPTGQTADSPSTTENPASNAKPLAMPLDLMPESTVPGASSQ